MLTTRWPGAQPAQAVARVLDHPDEFVAEGRTELESRRVPVIGQQVGPADRRVRDPDDRVGVGT